jgi:phage head maturation protease
MSNKEVKFNAGLDISRYANDDGKWIIEGIATTADLDVDGLYISEEALIGAENDLKKYTTLLYNHDRDKEIGKILEVKYLPEQRALWIKCLISKTVPDIWQKVNEGVLNKFSVSGTALDFTEKFIKGLDKVVQYVNQMRLFETSLVTVPADASARTLAFYVEKSMGENKKEKSNMSTKGKKTEKKIEKSEGEEKKIEKAGDETDVLARDQKALDVLIGSVTDALGSEDRGVQVDALRSALDFLKAVEATTSDPSIAKSQTLVEDIAKAVEGVFEAKFEDIKETVVALSKSTKEAVDKDAEIKKSAEADKEEKDEEKKIEKSAGDKEDKEEKKELKIEKSAEKEDSKDTEIAELRRGISDLGKMLKDNLPIRKGLGAEEHKEDERGKEKEEDSGDITRSEKYKESNPFEKLDMFLDQHIPTEKKEKE